MDHRRAARPPSLMLLALCTLLAACASPLPFGPGAAGQPRVGPIRRVGRLPFVYEADVAVDPTHPDHLAVTLNAPSSAACDPIRRPGSCSIKLDLAISTDGGASWQDHPLTAHNGVNASVAFTPGGTVYEAGTWIDQSSLPFVHRGVPARPPGVADIQLLGATPIDKPWLSIDARSGAFYVVYTAATGGGHQGILLQRSAAGTAWSAPVVLTPGPLAFAGRVQVAIPPFDAQALPDGQHVTVLWLDPADPGLAIGSNHRQLRVAVSGDGGATFAAARTITDTRSLFAAAVHDGTLYVLFRRGTAATQHLLLATSRDQGQTWTLAPVGDGRQLDADWSPAPGLSVAPDGTIDAVYYAPERPCFDPAALAAAKKQGATWTDPCTYDVWYTGSRDGGATWTAPRRLNPQPIRGEQFVHIQGMSRPGDYIGIASTDQDAYPVWIAGTAAYSVRIAR